VFHVTNSMLFRQRDVDFWRVSGTTLVRISEISASGAFMLTAWRGIRDASGPWDIRLFHTSDHSTRKVDASIVFTVSRIGTSFCQERTVPKHPAAASMTSQKPQPSSLNPKNLNLQTGAQHPYPCHPYPSTLYAKAIAPEPQTLLLSRNPQLSP
jgi:hypothetical protein